MTFCENLTYVIPVHNEERNIAKTVGKIINFYPQDNVRVILVENGSRDLSAQVCFDLQSKNPSRVMAISIPEKGLGYALFRGFSEYVRQSQNYSGANNYVGFVAAEIPFGFTDVLQIKKIHVAEKLGIYVGSKGLSESTLTVTSSRRVMSFFFYLLRRIILGLKVKDPQGTLFFPRPVIAQILEQTQLRDYFFTMELIYLAHRKGVEITEVPIEMDAPIRGSTVKPIRDSIRAIKAIFQLRFR